MHQRRKRNSSKVNLTFSIIFHSALILVVIYFAAREGMLGNRLKQITVTMAPKEKKPEPPKEKPAPPKLEPPKTVETPKLATTLAPPPPRVETAAPPPVEAAPTAAPAAVSLPAFEFNDGAKEVQSVSDPNVIYKGLVEHALRSRWNRPEDLADDQFTAEIQLSIDTEGNVSVVRWLKGSGNARWDDSVKAAIASTKSISRPPPKGFPAAFVTRFDVESMRTEDAMHLSSVQ